MPKQQQNDLSHLVDEPVERKNVLLNYTQQPKQQKPRMHLNDIVGSDTAREVSDLNNVRTLSPESQASVKVNTIHTGR